MKILDPHLKDGVHEWRNGKCFVKEGIKLYLDSRGHRYPRWQVCSQRISVRRNPYQLVLAAFSVVTLDSCVRNFSRFTGCSLGEAIKCVTYHPVQCLGIENRKGTLRPRVGLFAVP
jgi:N-acetylglucosamine-6-phosphate deacetylase